MTVDTVEQKSILQSFLVKSNLILSMATLVNRLPIKTSNRSGTIIALKYNNCIKGDLNLFKNKIGFKNACHLIMWHTLENQRKKKMVHVKMTSSGTFQIIGVSEDDVEKIVYKIFLAIEKLNKVCKVYEYLSVVSSMNMLCKTTSPQSLRFEIIIVPILCNYMVTLSTEITQNIFQNLKSSVVQRFIDNGFLCFMIPNDYAITIKRPFTYEEYKHHPIRHVTWNKKNGKYGKVLQYIEYQSYTTLLKGVQKHNSTRKKYLTLRMYTTGKVLVSCFNEAAIHFEIERFLEVCRTFEK
jgi:hypothetical protein